MKPKIIIVDENDQIVGYKDRNEIQQKDIYRVSALWLKNSKGGILLAKRAMTKKNNPGRWGPAVAGTVEEGESYEENIIKEANEELGLNQMKFIMGSKVRVRGKYNHFTQLYFLIINQSLSDFRVQREEVAEIKWFSQKYLLNEIKLHPENFIDSIRQNILNVLAEFNQI